MVKFGGNTFSDFSVPLVFEGRYFIMEPGISEPLITVVVVDNGEPVFEVLKNEPQENPLTEVSKTPPGIITVGDRETGEFLYKVRPHSETSVTFGKIEGGGEGAGSSVRITDQKIQVLNSDAEPMLDVFSNNFEGEMAGVLVSRGGTIAIGTSIPPEVRSWLASS